MGDPIPTPIDKTAQTLDDILQALIYDVAVNAVQVYSTGQMPWLGLPIIKQIFGLLLSKVAGLLYNVLSTYVTFTVIDFQTAQEADKYTQAVNSLQQAQASGDPNALSKAQDDFKSTLGKLIHFDGTTSS